jgi:hypothetical protein
MTDCSFISQFFAYLKNTSSQQQKKKKITVGGGDCGLLSDLSEMLMHKNIYLKFKCVRAAPLA